MIEEIQYKDWSLKFHNKHAHDPIVIQIELTYRCPLHCNYCYSDCYNTQEYTQQELSTDDVKKIIDTLYEAKSMWLCFTGGDPMMRPDFIELYDYARDKGFIVTIFTSLIALTDEILTKFKERPPFSIETTLNAATKETYEKISQVKGSFDKAIRNIKRILNAKLPLKIKTMLTKNNIQEIGELRKLIESFGCEFRPSTMISARLNGDTTPCQYRLPIGKLVQDGINDEDECNKQPFDYAQGKQTNRLFRCAVGNWQWRINPYGRLNICSCVREPSYDVLNGEVIEGVKVLSDYVKNKRFTKDSECNTCKIWHLCHSCPGKAKLEMSDEETLIPYFCELAKRQAKKLKL